MYASHVLLLNFIFISEFYDRKLTWRRDTLEWNTLKGLSSKGIIDRYFDHCLTTWTWTYMFWTLTSIVLNNVFSVERHICSYNRKSLVFCRSSIFVRSSFDKYLFQSHFHKKLNDIKWDFDYYLILYRKQAFSFTVRSTAVCF